MPSMTLLARPLMTVTDGQVLFDTSVLISWMRDGEGLTAQSLVAQGRGCITHPVRMEILLGIPRSQELRLRRDLARFPLIPLNPDTDFDLAAEIHRGVRRSGDTIRSSVDLIIAAVAIRTGLPLLHADKDFDRIAAVVPELVIYNNGQ